MRTSRARRLVMTAILFAMSTMAGCGAKAWHAETANSAAVGTTHPKPPRLVDVGTAVGAGGLKVDMPTQGFGVVPCASRRELGFSVTNHGDREAVVDRFRVSCDCLTVTLARFLILPGETVPGRLAIDLSSEPESHGNLSLEVEALDSGGVCLVSFRVSAEVRIATSNLEEL